MPKDAPYHGQTFQMKPGCALVKTVPAPNRQPAGPIQQIIDTNTKTTLDIEDTAAFILRFLVQKVDTNMIRELLKSEYQLPTIQKYNTADDEADALIQECIDHYTQTEPVLEPAMAPSAPPPKKAPSGVKPKKKTPHFTKLEIDFTVNAIGITVFKYPGH